ncbi:hypothetical protein GIB67_043266 [Kingdonia uniflora]|uniref:Cytochrome P450 n=1 Tax=Kingdonia uniflora TaxID=39325 RepID=A0A7J7L0P4_9MAGN|nr:hypothetical protein GIB67_043266 [Kingdonia uniflora]
MFFSVIRTPKFGLLMLKQQSLIDFLGFFQLRCWPGSSDEETETLSLGLEKYNFNLFPTRWPALDIVGQKYLVVLNGKAHARLRSYVSNAINRPDTLKKIVKLMQPHIVASLHSWVEKGKIRGIQETKKVCSKNFFFSSITYSTWPVLDELDRCFEGLMKGIRAQPINLPGAAYHHALQKKTYGDIQAELGKKKGNGSKDGDDLMDGLMRIKDEHGETLCDNELVVEETIRMANIVAFTFRLVSQGIEYKGHMFPKGWKVLVWFRCMHNDPNNFDNPMCFNPDRWNQPPKPGTYQVFGGGTRICAGNNLARLQLAIYLHHLAMGFK